MDAPSDQTHTTQHDRAVVAVNYDQQRLEVFDDTGEVHHFPANLERSPDFPTIRVVDLSEHYVSVGGEAFTVDAAE